MWNYNLPIFHETFYKVIMWFLIYSVLGWTMESIYISICNKKITNRGYVKGPICPIYGFGGIFAHTLLLHFAGNYMMIFCVGTFFATTLEYMTALAMIRVFGFLWWDYTNKPFNYKGILCLESTLAWGIFAIVDMAFLTKAIFIGIGHIPYTLGKATIVFAVIYYFSDFIVCTKKNLNGDIEAEENNILQFNH